MEYLHLVAPTALHTGVPMAPPGLEEGGAPVPVEHGAGVAEEVRAGGDEGHARVLPAVLAAAPELQGPPQVVKPRRAVFEARALH